jgi:hypothetical protein
MNYENTCVATVPIGMFPSKKMMSAMVVFVHPEALKNKIVNLQNYKEHLVFSLYVCPEDKLDDAFYALSLLCPFTYLKVHNGTINDLGEMVDAFTCQVKHLCPEAPADELEILIASTVIKASGFGEYIAEQLKSHFE